MIIIHENLAANTKMKPMRCPKCGYRRVIDISYGACVRKSRRGNPSLMKLTDMAFFKCKKCGHSVGISIEKN